jgi:large subunit ribosomal protein L15
VAELGWGSSFMESKTDGFLFFSVGKRIVDLETSLALVSAENPVGLQSDAESSQPSVLEGLPNLSDRAKRDVLDKSRLAKLATGYGLDKVTRWRPRRVCVHCILWT